MNIDKVTYEAKQTSKLTIAEKLTMMLKLSVSVMVGASLLTGCVIDREATTEVEDVCGESMSAESVSRADEACRERGLVSAREDECASGADCEEVVIEECGETYVVFCMENTLECTPPPPVEPCVGEGLSPTTPEACADNPSCQVITYYTNECGDEFSAYCIPDIGCPDLPRPTPEEACGGEGLEPATREACEGRPDCERILLAEGCADAEEIFCLPPEECDESGAIDPNEICGAEGFVPTTLEECEAGAECFTITTIGACDMPYDTLCTLPPITCDAWPSCPEGLAESPEACRRGELGCELATECGYVISCRPEFTCFAEPTCAAGEVTSQFGCEADEEECRAVEECGMTIFCRPENLCRGFPICPEGQAESDDPCLATESERSCRSHTECGMTITCR